MEDPMSLPISTADIPVAKAAAEPPEDPPGRVTDLCPLDGRTLLQAGDPHPAGRQEQQGHQGHRQRGAQPGEGQERLGAQVWRIQND